ncbi:hypothetical protein V5799_018241 [Amblyomma americanum]|uniref:Uncharacterized protein n=1 Tax=Amblyomma americanum TaxID=6943 RepID=A0AAQ4EZZ7_AMBAM
MSRLSRFGAALVCAPFSVHCRAQFYGWASVQVQPLAHGSSAAALHLKNFLLTTTHGFEDCGPYLLVSSGKPSLLPLAPATTFELPRRLTLFYHFAGVSEFKVEKAVFGTKKGIPKDAVFHKRAATTIWSIEAVAQCSSSSKCSGGDSGRYWATQLESSCCQGNARFSTFSKKMHATMQGASSLTVLPILSTNKAKDAFEQM